MLQLFYKIQVPHIIMVNGEKVDTIPTAPWAYEITIDYSELYEFLDYVEPVVEVILLAHSLFLMITFNDNNLITWG